MSVRDHLLPRLQPIAPASTPALHAGTLSLDGAGAVALLWDFSVSGGSCGVAEADAFQAAVFECRRRRLPLVSVLASGGTRLGEGMRALVGIPRMALALDGLRADHLPHLSVADQPTTGGVWVAVGCSADLRCGITGATVAFSGPRVAEAMTGRAFAPGAGTAEAAYAAGLLDAVVDERDAVAWLTVALHACVRAGRQSPRADAARGHAADPPGDALIDPLLDRPVNLHGGDDSVRAAVGRFDGEPLVAVALGSTAGSYVGAAGFGLLARAATLADTLDVPLVTIIDTLGGDPHDAGIAPAILAATRAVLACRAPTIALVAGAGGSGGALAGAVTDRVLAGSGGWFAALAPTGAAAALRRSQDEVERLMRIRPSDLIEDGFADASFEPGQEAAALRAAIAELLAVPGSDRLARRQARWSSPLLPASD